MLVGIVHWWPAPSGVGSVIVRWIWSYMPWAVFKIWGSHINFHFEGVSNFSASVEGLVQDVDPWVWKWNKEKLILNLCMNHMVHVFNTMWRIKNQPSNSTSCSDNTLHLLVLAMGRLCWGLQVTSSPFSIEGCVLKGCFERSIFWRAKSHLKGIEDFNLEHWPRPRSHLHSVGPRPSHASFIARFPCPLLHGNSSSLGTNVTILSQNYKYSSWHYFHWSQVNWWSSFTYQRSLEA